MVEAFVCPIEYFLSPIIKHISVSGRRLLDKEMEMVWHVGSDAAKEEIFTGALYHTYSPPPGSKRY
jgi:hypothetical protein